MSTPFKMKGFSGFGNSPLKQDEKKKKTKEEMTDKEIQSAIDRNQGKADIAWLQSNRGKNKKYVELEQTARDSVNIMREEQYFRETGKKFPK